VVVVPDSSKVVKQVEEVLHPLREGSGSSG